MAATAATSSQSPPTLPHPRHLPTSSTNLTRGEPGRMLGGGGGGGGGSEALSAILRLLRPQDRLGVAVRLETAVGGERRRRYLAILSTQGVQDAPEAAVLGMDYTPGGQATIGLALPILSNTAIELDDGAIRLGQRQPTSRPTNWVGFKPVSVQAMWSIFQSIVAERDRARQENYFDGGLSHTWLPHYQARVSSCEAYRAEWLHYSLVEEAEQTTIQQDSLRRFHHKPQELAELHTRIRQTLKDIMQSVDLDEVNTRDIRLRLEGRLETGLGEHKAFFDQEMMTILGQMEQPSLIFPKLYLGTEWNASNWEELRGNRVTHVLNVTREVDNFFQSQFNYMKIAVSDEASSELLSYWDECYRFIKGAWDNAGAVLVHCKKGISRSSSTVIAFAMKEFEWDLNTALHHVKEKRQCITPNRGFMEQLKTYQGILDASRHRNSALFNAPKEVPPSPTSPEPAEPDCPTLDELSALRLPTDPSDAGASSVIYSERADHVATEAPPLVVMSSGNILKPGCSSADSAGSLHLSAEEAEVGGEGDGAESPRPGEAESGGEERRREEEESHFHCAARPRLKKAILKRISQDEAAPLKDLKELLRERQHLSASSSGCSSDDSSNGSLSDEGDAASKRSGDSGSLSLESSGTAEVARPQRANPSTNSSSNSGLLRGAVGKVRSRFGGQRSPRVPVQREETPPESWRGPMSAWLKALHNKRSDQELLKSSPSLGKVAKSGTVAKTRRHLESTGKGLFFADPGSQRHLRLALSPHSPFTPTLPVRSLVDRFDASETASPPTHLHRSGSLCSRQSEARARLSESPSLPLARALSLNLQTGSGEEE